MSPARDLLVKHFQFSAAPFPLTPKVSAFFEGAQRRATLEALYYAIMNGEGIITVTGEVGCGKTMLSRMLIENDYPGLEVIFLGHPRLRTDELPGVLACELGLNIRFKRRSQVLSDLYARLMALHSQGKRVALIIDEAHLMSAEALEEIRLITNLDTSQHKLLQVVLFGQHELDATLASKSMQPLRERITERFVLAPLSKIDVKDYIAHRLHNVAARRDLIDEKAALHIARHSRGLMRRVNILCERSLMAAYIAGANRVTVEHARMASRDVPFRTLSPSLLARFGLRLNRVSLH